MARLLDFLAYRYGVLFLVSAGNTHGPLSLPNYSNWTAFETAPKNERERSLYKALDEQRSARTLLSPAEAMNVLMIGAAHRDAVHPSRAFSNRMDAIDSSDLPNLSSALGLGYRKVIKPDLLADGGKEHVSLKSVNPHLYVEPAAQTGRAFGLMAAVPDPLGNLTKTALTWGTSVATAVTTRAAHLAFDALMDVDGGSMLADTPPRYIPLIVKALLIHSSAWGDRTNMLHDLSGTNRYERKDNVSRFVGHGVLDVPRILECTAQRATLIGYGKIAPDGASLCRIPLPPGLEHTVVLRSVTVTLAWFSPINPSHQGYRMVALEAKPGGDEKYSLGVERSKMQPHDKAIDRGTVYHDRREGRRAVPYTNGGNLLVRISARNTAGESTDPVSYALAISIEVKEGSTIPVYDEIRNAVLARARPPLTP